MDAVQQVVDKINALPAPDQVTLNDEKLIKEAREAYDKLTDTQKQDSRLTQAIKNKLGDCETALEKAKKADRYRELLTVKCDFLRSDLRENSIWEWNGGANILVTGIVP